MVQLLRCGKVTVYKSARRSRHVPKRVRTVGMTLLPQPRMAEEKTSTQQNTG